MKKLSSFVKKQAGYQQGNRLQKGTAGSERPRRPIDMREEYNMELPIIGDVITTEKAIALCRLFSFDHLVHRIEADPGKYRNWKFDGCSGLPDEILGLFTGCNWVDITNRCCLPHDLRYAYGEKDNEMERKEADEELYDNLVSRAGMKKWCASAFLTAVRIGGVEDFGLSFSWGFAHKRTE
jgi:hypothetical protein